MPRHSYATFLSARPWGVTASLALATFLVAGCQVTSGVGSPVPKTSSTTASPAASASTSAPATSPSPAGEYRPADAHGKAQNVPVPVMPELAKENSKAGLEAFIGYWYAVYSYAIETGDLSYWLHSTNMEIPAAAAHQESVRSNTINGRWLAGGRLSTPVIEVDWNEGENVQSARVQVIQEAIQYFDAETVKGQDDSVKTNTADAVFAKYGDGAWLITDYGTLVG